MPSTTLANIILPFYPAYTFSASPTWFLWVKLTCDSIHHDLRPRDGFSSTLIDAPATSGHGKPLLLFYLNHPIQFVQVTGIVVALEEFHEHFALLTLDDSSGSTLDVIFWKPRPKAPADQSQDGPGDAADADQKPSEGQVDEANILSLLPTLQIGHCVQAKGTLSQFRGTRQLSLIRQTLVPTTTAELKLIDARTIFLNTVLSKPWHLSKSKLDRLREKAAGDNRNDAERARRVRKRAQAKLERELRHEKEILKQWNEEEKERERAAEQAKKAGEEVMAKIGKRRKRAGDADAEDDD